MMEAEENVHSDDRQAAEAVDEQALAPEESLPAEAATEAATDAAPEAEPVEAASDSDPQAEPAEVAAAPAEPEEPAAEAPAAPAAAPAYDESSPKKWFIIHTYSGFENKVKESLQTRSEAFGFADKIGQILIPTEEVVELRNGKKVTSRRLVYPGYVLVEMEMNDELWHAVKNTPRVTGFVGGGNSPVPLSADEVNQILYRQASSAERPRPKMTFEKNDSVRIVDGPFANFSGKVDEVNTERGTLRVMVTIFGRSTPVELEFLQVEKA
ncbi:MAG TPA: transcription termination/antitermination protein NusG [Bryobacteraceae bacterium]|jgi:transcriptional antiterminator NusG